MPRNSVLHGSLPCVEGELSRFRCHLGHAYGAELMSVALDENLAARLASAVRAIEERVALAQKLYTSRRRRVAIVCLLRIGRLKEFETRNGRYPQFDPPHGPPCRTGGYGESATE
jgi:hypothetical protein